MVDLTLRSRQDVQYDNVCIRDTKIPIFIDSRYSFFGAERDRLPAFRDMSLPDVSIQGGGKVVSDGYDEAHRLEMKLDNVRAQGALSPVTVDTAALRVGPGAVELTMQEPDVQVSGRAGAARPIACVNKFVASHVSSDQPQPFLASSHRFHRDSDREGTPTLALA